MKARCLFFILCALLAACGFHLRGGGGAVALPYASIYIDLPENAELRVWLGRYIGASGSTVIADNPKEAAAIFQPLTDNRQKLILSVDAQGRVREYRLQLDYRFHLINPEGQVLISPDNIRLSRDVSFNDANVLSKESEENLLWRDMNSDLASQIMRRMSLTKPQPKTATTPEKP